MNRLFKIILPILALVFLSMPVLADTLTDSGGNSLTASDWQAIGTSGHKIFVLDMIYTDSDGNGTTGIDIPVYAAGSAFYEFFLASWFELVETDPGAVAPTDNYDIYIKQGGADVFQGGLLNRDTATTENDGPSTVYVHPDGSTLSLVVEDNSQAGAIVNIKLVVTE